MSVSQLSLRPTALFVALRPNPIVADTCRRCGGLLGPSELAESSAAVLLAAELDRRWASVSVSSPSVLPDRDTGRDDWPSGLVRPEGMAGSLEVDAAVDAASVLLGRSVDGTGIDDPGAAAVGRRSVPDRVDVEGGGGGPIALTVLDAANPPDGLRAVCSPCPGVGRRTPSWDTSFLTVRVTPGAAAVLLTSARLVCFTVPRLDSVVLGPPGVTRAGGGRTRDARGVAEGESSAAEEPVEE